MQQNTDTTAQYAASASTAGGAILTERENWLATKLQLMECLLMINSTKELERWNNHLCKNLRYTEKYKLREIAIMVNIRRDQLKFKQSK